MSATRDVPCPGCGRVSRLLPTYRGEGRCPGCRRRLQLGDDPARPGELLVALLDPPAVDARPAGAAVRCASCQEPLGETGRRCAGCGTGLHAACWEGLEGCPACGQDPTSPPPADGVANSLVDLGAGPGPGAVEDPTTHPCPRCGGRIKLAAKKCRHCGDFLDAPPVDLTATRPCPLCGETIRAAAKKCRHCGEFLDASVQRGRRQGDVRFRLAAPAPRLLAYVIDNWLLNAPALALAIVGATLTDQRRTETAGAACLVLAGLLYLGLCVVQWRGLCTRGATLGKGWLGLEVVRQDGTPVDFVHGVLMRNWVMDVLGNAYIFGCMFRLVDGLMIFGLDRRTLHDHMAGTVVIEAGSVARGKPAAAP